SSGSVSTPALDLFGVSIAAPARKFLFLVGVVTALALIAKNLVRSSIGRAWMATRDMDVAAEVIGIRPVHAKLTAFVVSSFYLGVAGALWGFVYLGSWEPLAFDINMALNLLFMIIIGGLGSILGCFLGAAFMVILPIFLNRVPSWLGVPLSTATISNLEHMIFGGLIIFFLIVEPHGLARLWAIACGRSRIAGRRSSMKRDIARLMVVGFAGAVLLGTAGTAAAADELFVPVLVYRTGAYAPNGIPWADGFVDYLKLVNARDGGVNGVKLVWEECETEYKTDRGVGGYERLKSRNPIAVNPLSTGITFALTDKVPADKIPLFTTGYGRSDSADGSVFQWNFPLMGTYWNAADILIQ